MGLLVVGCRDDVLAPPRAAAGGALRADLAPGTVYAEDFSSATYRVHLHEWPSASAPDWAFTYDGSGHYWDGPVRVLPGFMAPSPRAFYGYKDDTEAGGLEILRLVRSNMPTGDQRFTATIWSGAPTAGTVAYTSIGVRWAAGGSVDGYSALYRGWDGTVVLKRWDGGTQVDLATASTGLGPGSHTVAVEAVGTGATVALKVFVDGKLYLTHTDASPTRKTAGVPALLGYASEYASETEPYWGNLVYQDLSALPSGTFTPPAYPRPARPAPTRTIYVTAGAPGGGDGSQASPYNALSQINNAGAASPGTRVYLAGDFGFEYLRMQSGTPEAWVEYMPAPGATVTLHGDNGGDGYSALFALGKSHWAIDAGQGTFNVHGISGATTNHWIILDGCADFQLVGLNVNGNPAAPDADDLTPGRFGYGRFSDVARGWIDGNTITRCGNLENNDGECMYFMGDCNDNTIVRNRLGRAGHAAITIGIHKNEPGVFTYRARRNRLALNRIRNRWASGINCNGLFGDVGQPQDGNLIEWNLIEDSGRFEGGHSIGSKVGILMYGHDTVARCNVVRNCQREGIKIQAWYSSAMPIPQHARRHRVYHNVVTGCGNAGLSYYVGVGGTDAYNEGHDVLNNVIYDNSRTGENTEEEAVFNGNRCSVYISCYHAGPNVWPAWVAGGVRRLVTGKLRHNLISRAPSRPEDYLVMHGPRAGEAWPGLTPGALAFDTAASFAATFGADAANNLWRVEPKWVDAAGGDYRYQSDSPCRTAGVPVPGFTEAGVTTPPIGLPVSVSAVWGT